MERIILEVDNSLKTFLKTFAEQNGSTMSHVLRGVIGAWAEKKRRPTVARKRKSTTRSSNRTKRDR